MTDLAAERLLVVFKVDDLQHGLSVARPGPETPARPWIILEHLFLRPKKHLANARLQVVPVDSNGNNGAAVHV